MTADNQIVLVVTGYTYHTNSDCAHVRSKQGRMLRRGDAESRGFKLCRLCALRERRENSLLKVKVNPQQIEEVRHA